MNSTILYIWIEIYESNNCKNQWTQYVKYKTVTKSTKWWFKKMGDFQSFEDSCFLSCIIFIICNAYYSFLLAFNIKMII